MKKYKFKIHYTSRKKNNRANALNRRCDYIKIKKIFDNSILQVNKDKKEQFPINKGRLQISKDKIIDYIKEHHDLSLQEHSRMIKTIQLLRQNCQFSQMRQKIETYIKKYLNYQRNKHMIHVMYEEIQS